RLQHFMPVQEIDVHVREGQFMVQPQAGLQGVFGKKFARGAAKCLSKTIEIFFVQCQARSHFVSTEFFKQSAATLQRVNEIEPSDASSASFPHTVVVETDHNRGPMIFASEPRCYDTKHTRMPASRTHHDSRMTRGIELPLDLLRRCEKDLCL